MSPSKKLRILFVTPEVMPFCKTGGVADVSSALPQKLTEQGHEVRVIVPKYGAIDERKFKIHEVVRLKDITTQINGNETTYSIRSSFLVGTKARVQVYMIDHNEYFGKRHGLYSELSTSEEFEDNAERFTLFTKSVFYLIKKLGWVPDIIHCNDWQCGLVPLYLKTHYKDDEDLKDIKCLLTIHNIAYQGEFDKEKLAVMGLPKSVKEDVVLHNDKVNFLKSGIKYADAINTVSETYANEIVENDEHSSGLINVLKDRKDQIRGIVNGIDYNVWNPEKDKLIDKTFSIKNLDNKEENKKVLAEKFGLDYDKNIPIIGIISKLSRVKGFEIIKAAFNELMKMDIQVVLLGTGEMEFQSFFEEALMEHRDKFSCYLGFDDKLAHLIEAGADMLLMPSKYEPCGLNQMYSLVYGTVPIVRETGGLADTVSHYTDSEKGNGFVFKEFSSKEMLKQVNKAVEIYQESNGAWRSLVENGMNSDFSWDNSTQKYIDLYKEIIN